VRYACGTDSGVITDGNGGQCAAIPDADGNYPALTITITVDGTDYSRVYAWNDYD